MDEDDVWTASRLKELINDGELETKQAGIAKIVINKGYNSLSDKQKFVYDRDIVPLLDDEETLEEGFQRNMNNPHA